MNLLEAYDLDDPTDRLVLADLLNEQGRFNEEAYLRGCHPLVHYHGRVAVGDLVGLSYGGATVIGHLWGRVKLRTECSWRGEGELLADIVPRGLHVKDNWSDGPGYVIKRDSCPGAGEQSSPRGPVPPTAI